MEQGALDWSFRCSDEKASSTERVLKDVGLDESLKEKSIVRKKEGLEVRA